MDIICLAQHENLVRFLGSCFENDSLLVYEFVANGSLDRTLFGMLVVTTYQFSIASCLAKVFKLSVFRIVVSVNQLLNVLIEFHRLLLILSLEFGN